MAFGFGALTVLAVLILLYAERDKRPALRWIVKPIAAAGFVLAGWANGALESSYGRALFVALILSAIGDILLIPKSQSIFRAGVIAFLLAHFAYVFAFFERGTSLIFAGAAALVLLPIALLIARKILPNVSGGLRGPVLAYMAVISSMVAFAISTRDPTIIAAAVLFYCSDLCVARERFVVRSFAHKLIGLPLYFGAQLVFVSTI